MAKTYRIIENPEPMTEAEIRQRYRGFWIYIVKATFGDGGELLRGTPVVIAEKIADGADEGIYNKYRTKEYENRLDMNLLPNKDLVSLLQSIGDKDE